MFDDLTIIEITTYEIDATRIHTIEVLPCYAADWVGTLALAEDIDEVYSLIQQHHSYYLHDTKKASEDVELDTYTIKVSGGTVPPSI